MRIPGLIKYKQVIYFRSVTAGSSQRVSCGEQNEHRIFLLPQVPTWIGYDTVGSHSPY